MQSGRPVTVLQRVAACQRGHLGPAGRVSGRVGIVPAADRVSMPVRQRDLSRDAMRELARQAADQSRRSRPGGHLGTSAAPCEGRA
jgi:hypothetical protein